jgi:hypothetical protein
MAKSRRRLFGRAKPEPQSAEPSDVAFPIGASTGDTPGNAQPRQKARTSPANRSVLLNRLALIFLILSAMVVVCDLLIFLIPGLPINPFPLTSLELPTIAPTPTPPPTSTPTNTPTATATSTGTPRPTRTSTPTDTPVPTRVITGTRRPGFTPSPTPTETPTVGPTKSPFNYTAEVEYQWAQLYGTNWSGIAGLVFGLDLKHQPGMTIRVWGDAPIGQAGSSIIAGTSPQYGVSGWEVTLGDRPVNGKWSVQLVDVNGNALSPVLDVELKGDPRANLAYVIFQQNH